MNIIGFDCETYNLPDDLSGDPPGLCCAGICTDSGKTRVFSARPRERMTPKQCLKVYRELARLEKAGGRICTWNGAAADFKWIWQELRGLVDEDEYKGFVRRHHDLMLHVLQLKGYPVGLQAVCDGFGIAGKGGCSGLSVPGKWKDGLCREVVRYQRLDAEATRDVARIIFGQGCVAWLSRKGRHFSVALPDGPLTVAQALELKQPFNFWMKSDREKYAPRNFVGWLLDLPRWREFAEAVLEDQRVRDSILYRRIVQIAERHNIPV